jgi:hypothetical protein
MIWVQTHGINNFLPLVSVLKMRVSKEYKAKRRVDAKINSGSEVTIGEAINTVYYNMAKACEM